MTSRLALWIGLATVTAIAAGLMLSVLAGSGRLTDEQYVAAFCEAYRGWDQGMRETAARDATSSREAEELQEAKADLAEGFAGRLEQLNPPPDIARWNTGTARGLRVTAASFRARRENPAPASDLPADVASRIDVFATTNPDCVASGYRFGARG